MSFFQRTKIVTHNVIFHTDDVFSAALLELALKKKLAFTRTRDPQKIAEADYVFDVGGVYDEAKNRFDHHQEGGAGKRENGIPYAAFGLLWKKFGEKVCASKRAAEFVEEKLVMPIDANDNGVSIYEAKTSFGVDVYSIDQVISAFRTTWKEDENVLDERFVEVVAIAKKILEREIQKANDKVEAEAIVKKAYADAKDKRVIFFDRKYPWSDFIEKYPEPLFVVFPVSLDNTWRIYTVRKEGATFANRKDLPHAWAGKKDEEFAKITGVKDAVFCHNGLFLAVAKSKTGAEQLVELALKN